MHVSPCGKISLVTFQMADRHQFLFARAGDHIQDKLELITTKMSIQTSINYTQLQLQTCYNSHYTEGTPRGNHNLAVLAKISL